MNRRWFPFITFVVGRGDGSGDIKSIAVLFATDVAGCCTLIASVVGFGDGSGDIKSMGAFLEAADESTCSGKAGQFDISLDAKQDESNGTYFYLQMMILLNHYYHIVWNILLLEFQELVYWFAS